MYMTRNLYIHWNKTKVNIVSELEPYRKHYAVQEGILQQRSDLAANIKLKSGVLNTLLHISSPLMDDYYLETLH